MTMVFKPQPKFLSLVFFALIVGLCGGVVVGVVGSLKFFLAGDVGSGVLVLFLAPIAQSLQFALLAAVSFPIFSWWCRRFGPPKLEGEAEQQQ